MLCASALPPWYSQCGISREENCAANTGQAFLHELQQSKQSLTNLNWGPAQMSVDCVNLKIKMNHNASSSDSPCCNILAPGIPLSWADLLEVVFWPCSVYLMVYTILYHHILCDYRKNIHLTPTINYSSASIYSHNIYDSNYINSSWSCPPSQ